VIRGDPDSFKWYQGMAFERNGRWPKTCLVVLGDAGKKRLKEANISDDISERLLRLVSGQRKMISPESGDKWG
jgi:hypothetical protein